MNSENQIRVLLSQIQKMTAQMNNTFEQAIVRHEEQFIKTYRVKITELTKLFEELTAVVENEFINNALTSRLDIVVKERDYFKYECLKLNMQYQTLQTEQTRLIGQLANVTDEMNIHQHLLEDQKFKNKQIESNLEKLKKNYTDIAYKELTSPPNRIALECKQSTDAERIKKKLELATAELKEKNEVIRNLRLKASELDSMMLQHRSSYLERKQLYDTWRDCANSWKRQVLTQHRKMRSSKSMAIWSADRISAANKKQLLKHLFTSSEFLQFIEKLLFDPHFQVQFVDQKEQDERYMHENRHKLLQYMRKKKVGSPSLLQFQLR